MPRIVLAKKHPPTSIEIPEREKGAILLLPGIPKKVTVDEVAFIKKNFPALSFAELPTKLQRRRKTTPPTTRSTFGASLSSGSTSELSSSDEKSDDADDDDKKKKKRGK